MKINLLLLLKVNYFFVIDTVFITDDYSKSKNLCILKVQIKQ
jgi:hypothetical protein